MRIGELAERAGVSTRALRYYEQQGLISARRVDNGYREYDESDVRLVAEIRSLLAAGFSLEDSRPFVDCLRAGHASGDSCPESVAVYRRKLAEIDGLTEENFEEQVLRADKPVLVDFWAEWCPPCKMIAPILEQTEEDYGDRLTIGKLNGDDHPRIAERYGVLGFPTLNLYRDGEVVHQIVGARSKRALLADLGGHI